MENRVLILFFLITVLSLLFFTASKLLLWIRHHWQISLHVLLWIALFAVTAIPLISGESLLELALFTNYTGGWRIEVWNLWTGMLLAENLYIPVEILTLVRTVCTMLVYVWLILAIAHISYGLSAYFNSLHFLTKRSTVCHDDRIGAIFKRACKKAGLRRPVTLRVMEANLRLSPCTCGINFPAVYVGRDYLYSYSDEWLELVFLHELLHIRHGDTFLKLITLFVTAVFSLLPTAKSIKVAVEEDVEYRCDRALLTIMGDGICGTYMDMILDVARRNIGDVCRAPDFLSPISRSGEQILTRYRRMKEQQDSARSTALLLPLLLAVAGINLCLVSVLTVRNIDDLGVDFASPLLEASVCTYFGVDDPHILTESALASVYSLEFSVAPERDWLDPSIQSSYLLACTLNEGLVWDGDGYSAPPVGDGRLLASAIPPILPHTLSAPIGLEDSYTLVGNWRVLTPLSAAEGGAWLRAMHGTDALAPYLAPTRVVDTRDLALLTGLRTLIFSNFLEASTQEVYTSARYAVIRRG